MVRTPTVGAIYVTASNSYRNGEVLVGSKESLWVEDLSVPARSQMIYPNGGEVWCSPTSLSMVMAHWANKTGRGSFNQEVPIVARSTYDYAYRGNDYWPFNTAYAASYGLKASVNRFSSLEQVERWIAKGGPVIASISWKSGRLTGTPIPASSGHLLAIRGFTAAGHVIVNDPAAGNNSGVRGSTNATSATRRGSSLARAEWHTSCAPRAGPSLTATSPVGAGSQAVAAPLLNHSRRAPLKVKGHPPCAFYYEARALNCCWSTGKLSSGRPHSSKLLKRLLNHSVRSCIILFRDGKLFPSEILSRAGRFLLPGPEGSHAHEEIHTVDSVADASAACAHRSGICPR